MPYRVCPKCQHELTTAEHFFCASCGSQLPKEVTLRDVKVRVRTTFFKEEKDPYKNLLLSYKEKLSLLVGKVSKRPLVEVLLLLNLLALCTFIYQLSYPKLEPLIKFRLMPDSVITEVPQSSATAEVNKVIVPEFGNSKMILKGTAGENSTFVSMFPNDTEVYAYLGNTSQLPTLLVNSYSADFIDEVKESTGSAAFGAKQESGGDYVWGLLVLNDFTQDAINSLITDFEGVMVLPAGDYLVITNSEDYALDIMDTMAKTRLSIVNDASYKLLEPKLPKSNAGILVSFKNNLNDLIQVFKGQAFYNETFKAQLAQMEKSGYNNFVFE